jgi:hypothetical protein
MNETKMTETETKMMELLAALNDLGSIFDVVSESPSGRKLTVELAQRLGGVNVDSLMTQAARVAREQGYNVVGYDVRRRRLSLEAR